MFSLLLAIFTFVELNCENFFDWYPDSVKDDVEFTPEGDKHWDRDRFYRKLFNIGRELFSCADEAGNIPDLMALCEVENDTVLHYLTRRSMLRKIGYEYVVTNSPDQRGINVAFVYNPLTFHPLHSSSIRVAPVKGMRPTRDILYLKGVALRDTLHCFAMHAPSRRGGEQASRPFRMAVARRLCQSVDSIFATNPRAKILIAGDFNDYAGDAAIQFIAGHNMRHVSKDAVGINSKNSGRRRQETPVTGTYRFQKQWNSLDHIFLSPELEKKVRECAINDAPFLLKQDSDGEPTPRRSYVGNVFQSGYSDHLPLLLRLHL